MIFVAIFGFFRNSRLLVSDPMFFRGSFHLSREVLFLFLLLTTKTTMTTVASRRAMKREAMMIRTVGGPGRRKVQLAANY